MRKSNEQISLSIKLKWNSVGLNMTDIYNANAPAKSMTCIVYMTHSNIIRMLCVTHKLGLGLVDPTMIPNYYEQFATCRNFYEDLPM